MRLIDANELKEWVENWLETNKYYHPYSKSNNIPINELYDILEHMPTVDAELVNGSIEWHGHWEKIEISKIYDCQNTMPIYKCSFCHTPFVNVDLKDRYHYCPNCGAKMEEEEEMDIKKYCIPKEEYNIPLVNEGIQEGRKLVRCKDCKYWDYDTDVGFCTRTEDCDWNADDFCSKGEKR